MGDLVLRLSEANNYPTPRMDIDALPCFKDLVRQKWSRSSSGSFSLHTLRLTMIAAGGLHRTGQCTKANAIG